MRGKPIYIAVENPPWKVERNQQLGRVRQALRRALPAQVYDRLEFKYSECAVKTSSHIDSKYVGRMTRKGWKWFDSELLSIHPGIGLSNLKSDGVFSDPEE